MNERTVDALNAINRAFYDRNAAAFDATRDHPWPGFSTVIAALAPGPLRVLDVGCGNGRFAAFLADAWRGAIDYLGVDASDALLARARARGIDGARFERCELLSPAFRAAPPRGPWDLVALFGLLHHVPSFDARASLVVALAEGLAPGGVLALTLWRLASTERFPEHRIDWDAYNATAVAHVDTRELEPGDHLVRWGASTDAPRYCHFCDAAETERLVAAVGAADPSIALARVFRSDGRDGDGNDYLLFRRTRS